MNHQRLRVSIVIPAYNEERHLEACLTSIAAQSKAPFEVIVVDNNSTDRTVEIARSFSFVRVVHERKQGIVHARNAGFDAAKGDIIGRIDGDTQLPQNWVARITTFYSEGHADEAWCGAGYLYNVRMARFISKLHSFFIGKFNLYLTGHYCLWGSNMALTARQWRAVRSEVCYRKDIHEDVDLSLHLNEAGYEVAYDPDTVVIAELKRFQSGREKLWEYLEWWPRSLRVHNKRVWVVAWILGAFTLYYVSYLMVVADKLAQSQTAYKALYRIYHWLTVER